VSTEPTHLFYGDFNCPFCYALSEQLHDLGLESLVSFRAVQHLLTPGEWARETPQSLVDEVERVRERAPGLEIRLPRERPRTALAIRALILAEREKPECVPALRLSFYRALWVAGRDISSPLVVGALVREQGFGPIGESPVLRLAARAWQDGWQSGGFDRRIPVLVAPGGARSMGLEESRRTATFLRAGLISSDSGDTCGGNARLGRF
jgi:2-hydroxychromene-2-carboxylate isomerase